MKSRRLLGLERFTLTVCLIGGVLLTIIGVRFALMPASAAYTFGVADRPAGFELHYVIAGRDIWRGLLAIGLALTRQWRGLAMWFAFGLVVCFADAAIVFTSSGGPAQVAFHVGSGIICGALTLGLVRLDRDTRSARA